MKETETQAGGMKMQNFPAIQHFSLTVSMQAVEELLTDFRESCLGWAFQRAVMHEHLYSSLCGLKIESFAVLLFLLPKIVCFLSYAEGGRRVFGW